MVLTKIKLYRVGGYTIFDFYIGKSKMKILLLISALFYSFALTACAVYTPKGSVVVDPNGVDSRHTHGKFCPPGQAKKGNC